MSNPPNPDQLHPLVEQGVELLRELQKRLQEERSALESRDLEALQRATSSKESLLAAVQENFTARHNLLSSHGVELSAEGWEQYLNSLPQAHALKLSEQWQALSETLEQVQQESRVNQQIILRGQESTERLLNMLQGKNQKSQLYGSSGKSNNFSTQSRIGKA
ncbi:flagellar protein FlgN [Marinobacterium sp. D7]|uniref:flagella synthesis protein FlgN n=1 Tax=Marinobacterium ramblicola TaxID=2849041 RepID=UPI001C2D0D4A|nr:flagellar protein FlgN [Marinobacterium ramblicola]MBV1788848.1 flagellar protein FlgN [Marinobacterium ramblicola]